MPPSSFGDFLVDANVITKDILNHVLSLQKSSNEKIDKILIAQGYLDSLTVAKYLSEYLRIPLVNLVQYSINPTVVNKLPESYARRFQAILLEENQDNSVLIGMVNPADIFAIDELARVLGKSVKPVLVEEIELARKLNLIYRRTEDITDFAKKLDKELQTIEDNSTEKKDIQKTDYAVEKLIESLFADAEQIGASDIHIEPAESVLRVRMRVDGLLQEQIIATREKNIANALSQRLKLMSGLNIAEKRLPQDGGFSVSVRSTLLDVRLSTMPTVYGESIVMRLLRPNSKLLNLDSIGMPSSILKRFRQLIKSPHGMILVTGPTGSGKTTTLYGALAEINEITRNIVTVEDPVEYRIERINQIQINPQIGLTFARVLKAILRQDPNTILIGEIRDQETASIALRAALTGQLVFATLHTNDAPSTAIRLIDIGVEGYLVAATVRAVLSQRLVRHICPNCCTPYILSASEEVFIKNFLPENNPHIKNISFKTGTGCSHCNYSGYQGRIGVYELLEFNKEMLEALRRNATSEFMQLANKSRTSTTLIDNVMELAAQGITTVSEVLRLAGE